MVTEFLFVGCLIASQFGYVAPQPGADYDDDEYMEFVRQHGEVLKACGRGIEEAARAHGEHRRIATMERKEVYRIFHEQTVELADYIQNNHQHILSVGASAVLAMYAKGWVKSASTGAFINDVVKDMLRQLFGNDDDKGFITRAEFENFVAEQEIKLKSAQHLYQMKMKMLMVDPKVQMQRDLDFQKAMTRIENDRREYKDRPMQDRRGVYHTSDNRATEHRERREREERTGKSDPIVA